MPSSTAGVVNFSEETHSKFHLKPGHVVAAVIIVIILIGALHYFGQNWV